VSGRKKVSGETLHAPIQIEVVHFREGAVIHHQPNGTGL
jgi:hypothetical protein